MKSAAVLAPSKLPVFAVMLATSLMLPSVATAQRGSSARSGTLPSQPQHPGRPPTARPLPQPPASQQQPPSPFAAGPRTYAPRYDVPANGGGRGYGRPFVGGGIGGGYVELPSNGTSSVDDVNALPADVQSPRVVQIGPSRTPVAVANVSHGPDTFYVIAGCYAGNHPPDPQRLPKGCDAAKLRATPVR